MDDALASHGWPRRVFLLECRASSALVSLSYDEFRRFIEHTPLKSEGGRCDVAFATGLLRPGWAGCDAALAAGLAQPAIVWAAGVLACTVGRQSVGGAAGGW